jgi:hypothetical protein
MTLVMLNQNTVILIVINSQYSLKKQWDLNAVLGNAHITVTDLLHKKIQCPKTNYISFCLLQS